MMKRWIASPPPLARGLRPEERRPAFWRRWCSATLALLPVALVTLMALASADTRTPGAWHSAPQPPGLLVPSPGGTGDGEGYWVVDARISLK